MTMDLKSDINEYARRTKFDFYQAKEKLMLEMINLNNSLAALDETIFFQDGSLAVSKACLLMKSALGDIQPYVKNSDEFPEFYEIINEISIIYNDGYKIKKMSSNIDDFTAKNAHIFQLLKTFLKDLVEIPKHFVFDEERILKNYRKYVGESVKVEVSKMIMKNKHLRFIPVLSIASMAISLLSVIIIIFYYIKK